jgi:GH3 auxin-responsive promoter.
MLDRRLDGAFHAALRDWCGEGVPFRDAGYMASEGIFTVPQANNSVDGLPALHAVFFEFLAEHDFGKPDAPALLAHELEPGATITSWSPPPAASTAMP